MKNFLSLLLILTLVFCVVGCGEDNNTDLNVVSSTSNAISDQTTSIEQTNSSNGLTEEQIRKIVQEELKKNSSADTSDKFVVGEKLKNLYGENFKMPITGQKDCFVQITSITATKKKEADISNVKDYYSDVDNDYRFYRYVYDLTITGKVDKNFKGDNLQLLISLDGHSELGVKELINGYNVCVAMLNADGTFKLEALMYCDRNAKSIKISRAKQYW
ncbi:MAG: hypothetical protein J6S13_08405 [Clostridia bacterium]|nr:hypothetical protein [Clostridia bacterium]